MGNQWFSQDLLLVKVDQGAQCDQSCSITLQGKEKQDDSFLPKGRFPGKWLMQNIKNNCTSTHSVFLGKLSGINQGMPVTGYSLMNVSVDGSLFP